MKVLFLDFDGVITCTRASYENRVDDTFMPGRNYLDGACLAELHGVIQQTGCRIVVSSSWRHGKTLEWLAEFLEVPAGIVIGKTCGDGEVFTHDSDGRGNNITQWLADHGRDVDNWAVVDDDLFDMNPWMLSRIVHTSHQDGLTSEKASELIALLGVSRGGESEW